MHLDCFVLAWICFLKALLQIFQAVVLAKALTKAVWFSFGNVYTLFDPFVGYLRVTPFNY